MSREHARGHWHGASIPVREVSGLTCPLRAHQRSRWPDIEMILDLSFPIDVGEPSQQVGTPLTLLPGFQVSGPCENAYL